MITWRFNRSTRTEVISKNPPPDTCKVFLFLGSYFALYNKWTSRTKIIPESSPPRSFILPLFQSVISPVRNNAYEAHLREFASSDASSSSILSGDFDLYKQKAPCKSYLQTYLISHCDDNSTFQQKHANGARLRETGIMYE